MVFFKSTKLLTLNVCVCFPDTNKLSNSLMPAECPTISLTSDTNHPELVQIS